MSKINIGLDIKSIEIVANVEIEGLEGLQRMPICTLPYSEFVDKFCRDETKEVNKKKSFKDLVDDKMAEPKFPEDRIG